MSEIDQIAEEIARRLIERGESVAVAESAAGGLISAALLGVAGASAYYKGGVVVYTTDGKQRLAGLTREALEANRSATVPHTALLAHAIRDRLGASWGIAETGAAGPTGNRYGDAAGHAALAVSGPIERAEVIETGQSDRRQNMAAFALAALRLLRRALEQRSTE
ncbi:MAG TPA: CinA family protein [Chloroflexota bacterium]|nr:CinA family protein [Chloroflexota bacterium]